MNRIILILAAAFLAVPSCSKLDREENLRADQVAPLVRIELTEGEQALRNASNDFGIKTFRSLYDASNNGSVAFSPRRNAKGVVLYGPDLPFPAGQYKATLVGSFAEGDAFVASTIGDGGKRLAIAALPADVVKGPSTATITFSHDGLLPLRLAYHFAGRGASSISRIELSLER